MCTFRDLVVFAFLKETTSWQLPQVLMGMLTKTGNKDQEKFRILIYFGSGWDSLKANKGRQAPSKWSGLFQILETSNKTFGKKLFFTKRSKWTGRWLSGQSTCCPNVSIRVQIPRLPGNDVREGLSACDTSLGKQRQDILRASCLARLNTSVSWFLLS